ncbi:MAG TPA: F0F1 ATP synthase subunit delta [Acidimicrobiales bacterium]|jgi:F-type H+-transporting ATPase subunit delta|nr:F0F1 ATP synthase subunit delta [Acidimicrobiales bacterium]
MNAALMGYQAAVLGGLDEAARGTVADELTALEGVVVADAALRSALSDTSIARGQRRAVVTDLLAPKLSGAATRIAGYAAFSSSAQDVPASIGEGAHRARAFVHDGALEEPALSVLASRYRVAGYAAAVLEDQPVSTLEGVEDELFAWSIAIENSAELRRVLTNRDLTGIARALVVTELLRDRVHAVTVRLAAYAVLGGRPRDLLGTLGWLVDRVAEERGWRVARVRTAREIDSDSRERLSASLHSLVGSPVELEVADEASLLGGVLVEVGDLRVDATIRGRLDALRDHFTMDRPTERSFDSSTANQGAG